MFQKIIRREGVWCANIQVIAFPQGEMGHTRRTSCLQPALPSGGCTEWPICGWVVGRWNCGEEMCYVFLGKSIPLK